MYKKVGSKSERDSAQDKDRRGVGRFVNLGRRAKVRFFRVVVAMQQTAGRAAADDGAPTETVIDLFSGRSLGER